MPATEPGADGPVTGVPAPDDARLRRWRTVSSTEIYRNPWIRVREDRVEGPDGRPGLYGVVTTAPAVGVLPFVDDDHVLLVRQRRYVTGAVTWEMPTGGAEPGEPLVDAARRELAEETGHAAAVIEPLTSFVSSKSILDETAHLFVARDLVPTDRPAGDPTEVLSCHRVRFDDVVAMVTDGVVVDAMTVVAVLLVARVR